MLMRRRSHWQGIITIAFGLRLALMYLGNIESAKKLKRIASDN